MRIQNIEDDMFRFLALLVASVIAALPAMAQEFPKKQPIKLVVAFNPGGLTDVLARITAEYLQRRLGQAVVVENRTGASGAIAADYVAKSAPDGYTLYLAAPEVATLPAVRTNLPFKGDDFTFLIRPFTTVPLLVVGPKVPFSTAQELVSYMKANPGKLRYGTPGVGHLTHLGTAMFSAVADVKGVHVPYTGIAPIYTDLVAGTIDFTVGATPPFPDSLKVLGPMGSKRHPVYPNLPTLEELGFKNASHEVWFGFVAPPNLPKPIADRLIAELGALYKDPEVLARLQTAAKAVPEVHPLTGEDFKKQVLQEQLNWKTVVEREKIVVQQ
jgi:tripartite-type tricarboxylate transporter receptor subunit TctC